MERDFYIVPCKDKKIAYIGVNKSTFKIERFAKSNNSAFLDWYKSSNIENLLATIAFKHSLLELYILLKSNSDGTAVKVLVANMSAIDGTDVKNKILIDNDNIIELSDKGLNNLDDIENYLKINHHIKKVLYTKNDSIFFANISKANFIAQGIKGISPVLPGTESQESTEQPNSIAEISSNEIINNNVNDEEHFISKNEANPAAENNTLLQEVTVEEDEEIFINDEDNYIDESDFNKTDKELGIDVTPAKENKEKQDNKISEEEKSVVITYENLEGLISDIIKDYIGEAEASKSRLEAISQREAELSKKEAELSAKTRIISDREIELKDKFKEAEELKHTLAEAIEVAKDNTVDKISTQVIDVQNIVSLNEQAVDAASTSDMILYESMLKAVMTSDSISIPRDLYNKLIVTLKKHLSMNRDYTEYRAIVQLRFDRTGTAFMLAVVDYKEELDYVRVTVLKPYNTEQVSQEELLDYEIRYNEWRKKFSFTNA